MLILHNYPDTGGSRVSFLQAPFRDNALALLLAFGSAKTGPQDSHLGSHVTMPGTHG